MERDQARRDAVNARRRQLRDEKAAERRHSDDLAESDPENAVNGVNGHGNPRPHPPPMSDTNHKL